MGKIITTFKQYPRTFWVANTIELFERWAWYGFYMLFANYLTGSFDEGGLEFSQNQKSLIMAFGTGILYFLPIITGAIADYFGYKKVLILSFLIYVSGFGLFPMFTSYQAVFAIFIYTAIGGALFKPIISATVAKTTNDSTASIGFGIFYMMVNVGSFLGPLTTLVAKKQSSDMIFYVSAALIAVNFLLVLFYKEPDRQEKEGSLSDAFRTVGRQIVTVFQDGKFVIFLCIIAIFWAMYFQLFYTLPVFIGQWIDSSALYDILAQWDFIKVNYTKGNQMDPEFITNMDSMFIILFQVIVSSIVMRMKPLHSMMTGIIINAIGLSLTFMTQNVFFVIFSLFLFGIGEMAASPKVTEYIGRIAPRDKKALYMGFSFVPLFIGSMLAGILSGPVYQSTSDRTIMVEKYADEQNMEIAEGFTQNEFLVEVASQSNMKTQEFVRYLWENQNPSRFWYVVILVGLFATFCLFLYNKFLLEEDK